MEDNWSYRACIVAFVALSVLAAVAFGVGAFLVTSHDNEQVAIEWSVQPERR
jgi:hypothetical protein